MIPFSDTHAHLDFEDFNSDRKDVIDRARANGLQFILNISIDLTSLRNSLALARENPGYVFVAAGIHPNYSANFDQTVFGELKMLATETQVVAIGEIGLDFYRDHATPQQQRRALETQLALSEQLGLPIVVHERSSAHELVPVLTGWHKNLSPDSPLKRAPGVMHAYSGGAGYVEAMLECGFCFGIGGPVTYKNAADKRSLVEILPLKNMLLETDCPFLPPHPHRGKRNEPAFIPLIAEKIAEIRALPIEMVGDQLTRNAIALFGLDGKIK